MTVSIKDGKVTCKPTVAGVFTFKVQATDGDLVGTSDSVVVNVNEHKYEVKGGTTKFTLTVGDEGTDGNA